MEVGGMSTGVMTSDEGRAYLQRWALVQAAEDAALRCTPLEVKLRQVSALMASRDLFGVEPEREAGVQTVRERWASLRQALRG